MPPQLKQYVNRVIMAVIPPLFGDEKCHPVTLRGIDADGLWISSAELLQRLVPAHDNAAPDTQIFVAMAQIAALLLIQPPAKPAAPTPAKRKPAAKPTSEGSPPPQTAES